MRFVGKKANKTCRQVITIIYLVHIGPKEDHIQDELNPIQQQEVVVPVQEDKIITQSDIQDVNKADDKFIGGKSLAYARALQLLPERPNPKPTVQIYFVDLTCSE